MENTRVSGPMGADGYFGLIIPGLHPGLVERPFQGRKTKPGMENGRAFRPERPILSAQVGGLGIDGRPGNRRAFRPERPILSAQVGGLPTLWVQERCHRVDPTGPPWRRSYRQPLQNHPEKSIPPPARAQTTPMPPKTVINNQSSKKEPTNPFSGLSAG